VFPVGLILAWAEGSFQPETAKPPQSPPDEPPVVDAPRPERATAHPPSVDVLPKLGPVFAAFGPSGGRCYAEATGSSTRSDSRSFVSGGFELGCAPVSRLTLRAFAGRRQSERVAPEVGAVVRVAGDLENGFALAILGQYKSEGFTEVGGEAEAGLAASHRSSSVRLDSNLIVGAGVEERDAGEADVELRQRAAFVVPAGIWLGAMAMGRKRLSGDRSLPGNRTWDALAGPELAAWTGPAVASVSGGVTTVGVARTGWFVALAFAGVTN